MSGDAGVQVTLERGIVAEHAIDACVATAHYDLGTLTSAIEYRSNDRNLDAVDYNLPGTAPTLAR